MGYKDWFVDSEIISPGTAEQGFEGLHYFWSVRLHKEAFAAIVQTKVQSHTKALINRAVETETFSNCLQKRPSRSV